MSPPAPPGSSRRRGPVTIALSILLVAVGVLVAWSWRHCAGHLVYALDDAYIHMAMARNLAEHGVFGVKDSTNIGDEIEPAVEPW